MNEHFKYFYSCDVSLDGNSLLSISRMPVVSLEPEAFNLIYSNNVVFISKFHNLVKGIAECIQNKTVVNKTIVLFSCGDKHVVVEINDKTLSSVGKCLLDQDSTEEYMCDFANKPQSTLYNINIVKETLNKKNIIYSTQEIVLEVRQQELGELFGGLRGQTATSKTNTKDLKIKLEKLGCVTNLNTYVKENNITITGFQEELNQLIKGLLHIRKPNIMLTGEPGVGKTALVEKFACAINNKETVPFFWDKTIYELNIANSIAGTKYRGEFEEKMKNIIDIVENCPDIILFIDEAHTIIGAGGAEGAVDASNIFKPGLARGKIRVIGATTKDEYEDSIAKDKALARRFMKLEIVEPDYNQVTEILKGVKPRFEKHYGITIDDTTLEEIHMSSLRLPGMMPDAAIDELENYFVNKYYEENLNKPKEEQKTSSPKTNKKKESVK